MSSPGRAPSSPTTTLRAQRLRHLQRDLRHGKILSFRYCSTTMEPSLPSSSRGWECEEAGRVRGTGPGTHSATPLPTAHWPLEALEGGLESHLAPPKVKTFRDLPSFPRTRTDVLPLPGGAGFCVVSQVVLPTSKGCLKEGEEKARAHPSSTIDNSRGLGPLVLGNRRGSP